MTKLLVTFLAAMCCINSGAFRNHQGLTSITIPESVTSIGDGAFWGTGLTKVEIGKSVETIGEDAFRNCTNMTEIYVFATTPPTLGEKAFDKVPTGIPVYVPNVEIYTGWGGFTNLINEDLPTAKEEAIADLQTFIDDNKIANAPLDEYVKRINAATSADEVTSVVNDIKDEIGNFKIFTLGDWKYLLDEKNDDYTIVDNKLTFNDKDTYQSGYDFTVTGNLTYSRTFANTNWQALYVPFAISHSDWGDDFDVAAINNFHEYTNEYGKTVKTELEVRLVTSGTLKPNHPYLIRAKEADEINPKMIILSTKKISKSEEKSYSCSSMESKYTFTGTYKEMKNLMTSKFIFMSGGKLCKAEDDNVALSPQRWYLKIESLGSQVDDESGSANAKAMQFDIKLLDDEATGIDEITVTRTPLHSSSEAVYNLNGMRVNDNYKGIVIRNGKKVYQK